MYVRTSSCGQLNGYEHTPNDLHACAWVCRIEDGQWLRACMQVCESGEFPLLAFTPIRVQARRKPHHS